VIWVYQNKNFLKWAALFLAALVLAVGVYAYHRIADAKDRAQKAEKPAISINTDGQQSKPHEPQIVYVKGQDTVTKEIVYVSKETDPVTGQLEKTDVQFEHRDKKVYVKVNGKEFEVPDEVTEDAKFDKGKLVITEQTEMRVNITAPKPAFNFGVGWSNHGPAAQINGPLYKNASWWVFGNKETVAGGVQFPIMK
jgi:hypothetical protein